MSSKTITAEIKVGKKTKLNKKINLKREVIFENFFAYNGLQCKEFFLSIIQNL